MPHVGETADETKIENTGGVEPFASFSHSSSANVWDNTVTTLPGLTLDARRFIGAFDPNVSLGVPAGSGEITVTDPNTKVTYTYDNESMRVLRECIDVQRKKGQDYQSAASSVRQAMHYRRGVDTIYDTMMGKMLRAQSLMESGRAEGANYESLEDTFKDLINYVSFAVAYMRGKIDGQNPDNDMFNRPRAKKA